MRGGRNKFGPIYRRDRALRRQIRSQLQNDPDLEVVAKVAATAALARADLDVIAEVAATSKASADDPLSAFSQSGGTDVVDVKPDVAELCSVPDGKEYMSADSDSPRYSSTSVLRSSAYLSTTAAASSSTSSNPLEGLSGMAAALLSQFLQQQQFSSPSASVTSHLATVSQQPSKVAVSTQVILTQMHTSVYPWSETSPLYTSAQYFTSRLTAAGSQPTASQKSAAPPAQTHPLRPVRPQQYIIPIIQNLPSLQTPQPPITTVSAALHGVVPQQSVIPAASQPFASQLPAVAPVVTPQPSVISMDHPATPQQSLISAGHAVTPQQSAVSAVRTTPDVSAAAVRVSGDSGDLTPPSSSSSTGELHLSSLELSGVPQTLRLIFDLKRQAGLANQLGNGGADRLRRFVDHLLQQPVASVTSSMEVAVQRAVSLACRVCDQQLFLLVDWARQAHFFRHLPVTSHLLLSDFRRSL